MLGIDPSFSCTGLVVLDSRCSVVTYMKLHLTAGPERYLRAAMGLHSFIKGRCKPGALKLAVLEDAAYGAPSRVVVGKLKELSGVYKAVLEGHHVPWLELSPSSAKRFITGKGNSEKHIVARELASRFDIKFKDDKGYDLSDAAACAAWGVRHFYGEATGQQKEGE